MELGQGAPEQEKTAIRAKPGELLARFPFEKDKVIFREGHDGTDAFVLESGRVGVFKTIDGKPVRLAVLEKGAMFGEMAAITGERRSATTIALEPCIVVRISKSTIQQKMNACDPFIKALVAILINNLSRVNERYATTNKVAEKLLTDLKAANEKEKQAAETKADGTPGAPTPARQRLDHLILPASSLMLLALLSPAKRLDFESEDDFVSDGSLKATAPMLADDAVALAARAKRYSARDLQRLMDISPALAALNHARFQAFDDARTRPAIYAFAGDVYQGFDAGSLSAEDIAFAQDHVGILSGLYGLLRPLDAIAPYRLEMGTRVKTDRGKDLYAFWRGSVTARVNAVTSAMKNPAVVNLASVEYWSVLDEKALTAPVVQPVFKEIKAGKAQIVSFLAKKARGLMARYIVENRVATPEGLKHFDIAGYAYDGKASTEDTWIFSRKSQ